MQYNISKLYLFCFESYNQSKFLKSMSYFKVKATIYGVEGWLVGCFED